MKSCLGCADKEYLIDIEYDGPCKFCGPKKLNWREVSPSAKPDTKGS